MCIRDRHKIEDADMIVCWEHDWEDCPKSIEVLELKDEIRKLENITAEAPDKITKSSEYEIDEYLKGRTKESVSLFHNVNREVLKIDDNVYNKAHKYRIFYYSPRRVFLTLKVLKKGLNITLFTNAKKIRGVEPFGGEYGQKWGRLYVITRKDIPTAVGAAKRAHKLINYCVANNIPTGWHAEVDE